MLFLLLTSIFKTILRPTECAFITTPVSLSEVFAKSAQSARDAVLLGRRRAARMRYHTRLWIGACRTLACSLECEGPSGGAGGGRQPSGSGPRGRGSSARVGNAANDHGNMGGGGKLARVRVSPETPG